VVEGVGDHGCEYMTGGRVVVIGNTGRNFAAGMSGGIAYVYDDTVTFREKCNTDMVELLPIDEADARTIRMLLENHIKYTSSARAAELMENFYYTLKRFVKVMPIEYKQVLELAKKKKFETKAV
jgi:glutamate synthase domain-containing protein 3